jgi:hypothetical protein
LIDYRWHAQYTIRYNCEGTDEKNAQRIVKSIEIESDVGQFVE